MVRVSVAKANSPGLDRTRRYYITGWRTNARAQSIKASGAHGVVAVLCRTMQEHSARESNLEVEARCLETLRYGWLGSKEHSSVWGKCQGRDPCIIRRGATSVLTTASALGRLQGDANPQICGGSAKRIILAEGCGPIKGEVDPK